MKFFIKKNTLGLLFLSVLFGLQQINQAQAEGGFEGGASSNAKCYAKDWKGITRITARVVRGVDGDTVKIAYKGKQYNVRLLSIDTPETHYMGKSQGEWGDIAAARMEEMIGEEGSLIDVMVEENNACDHYGRLLGYLYQGDKNLNEEMARECLAVMYCIYPSVGFCSQFGEHTTACIKNKEGIFSDSSVEIPYEWRRLQSNRDYEKWLINLKTNKVYAPDEVEEVPVGDRLFFMKKAEVDQYLSEIASRTN